MTNPRKTWMPLLALLALFAVASVSCGPGNGTPPPGGDIEVRIIVDGPGRVIQGPLPYQCRDDCVWMGDGDVTTRFDAVPAPGYVFVGWAGVCDAFTNPCTRKFEDGDTITATFALHALRLDLTGDGEGAFRIQGAGINADCADDCAFGLDTPGLLVAITAFPSSARTTLDPAWQGPCDPITAVPNYCLVAVTGVTTVGKTWRHPPVAVDDDTYATKRNSTLTVGAANGVLINDDDTPGDTRTAILVTPVMNGTLALAADGGFSYTPDLDFVGSDTFTYRARDAFGNLSNVATVTITVEELDLPTIDSFTATPGTITVGQSSTLAWTVTNATLVEITDATDTVIYGGTDLDTITLVTPTTTTTYTLTATNTDGSTTDTVAVTVLVPPVIESFTADDATIEAGNSTTLRWNVTGADTITIDDGTSNIAIPNDATTVEVTPDTTTTYTLTATNEDGQATATTTVTVTVTVSETRPIAVDDAYSTTQDSTLRRFPGQGVLANDIGDNLTANLVDDAGFGDLTLRGSGSFTYEPDDDFIGIDAFTYFAHDGIASSNIATVTITVNGQ